MARAFKPPVRFRPKSPKVPRLPKVDEPYEDVYVEMTLQEHLEELRDRIVKVCLTVGAGFAVGFFLADPLLQLIAKQAKIPPEGFQVNGPAENFTVYMKVALYIAIGIGLPVIVWHIIGFLSPGLSRKEKRVLYTALPFISGLFFAGVLFAFFLAAPRAFEFLASFKSSIFYYQPTAELTISFYLQLMLGLGLAFEMPLAMFLLAKIGIVSPQRMTSFRKYAFVIIIVAAAIITPTPDPFNLAFVAIPLYALFEVGLIVSRVFGQKPIEAARNE